MSLLPSLVTITLTFMYHLYHHNHHYHQHHHCDHYYYYHHHTDHNQQSYTILPLDFLVHCTTLSDNTTRLRHMHTEHYIPFHTHTNNYKFSSVLCTLINWNALAQQAVDIADTRVSQFRRFLQSLWTAD